MTQLSRAAILGIAKETVLGTYVAPTSYIPFTKASFVDNYSYIKDESIRANDTTLQGLYQGPMVADWDIECAAYPDAIGPFLRNIIGPDTVVAGVSTTLSASSSVNATSISTTAAIPVGSYIKIDTGTSLEYAKVSASSGSGPYVLTVSSLDSAPTGLLYAHTSGAAVVSTSTHTFAQNFSSKATHSLTVFDTVSTIGYTDVVLSDLDIKIDPKGMTTFSIKAKSQIGTSQSAMTPAFTTLPPSLGWQWQMTNAGASSTRGLSYDVKVARQVETIWSSDGLQSPREIFQGALTASGSYKAIFENQTDLNLYVNNTQLPCTAVLQQPIRDGGGYMSVTMSKSGWSKGQRDWGSQYVQADFDVNGIYNATDGGAMTVVIKNFVTTAY
jgi:hypothetical protein